MNRYRPSAALREKAETMDDVALGLDLKGLKDIQKKKKLSVDSYLPLRRDRQRDQCRATYFLVFWSGRMELSEEKLTRILVV